MKLWLSSVTTQCITHHHDIECPNARNQVIKIYKSGPLSINSLPPILILRSRSLLEKSTATQHILIFFEQPRFFSSGPLLHLRTKPRSTSILWPPPFHPPDGNMSERPPMCIYIGRIFICGHTEIDLYLNCTNCVQRIQQIQYQPGAPYSYSWPGRCEPTTGVNILFMRPPPSQVCRRCHRDGFQWRGSTGLYSWWVLRRCCVCGQSESSEDHSNGIWLMLLLDRVSFADYFGRMETPSTCKILDQSVRRAACT